MLKVSEEIDNEIEFLVIQNGSHSILVWRGTQKHIVDMAKDQHFFSYEEYDKESFLDVFGDFEGFEAEEKIINDTGSVVMVSLNTNSDDDCESMPKSKSRGIFEYALYAIFLRDDHQGECFPESELKNNLKNLNDKQIDAVNKFLKNSED